MLRNIKLKNFKCFEQLDLDCRPLNLLCGLNGTGKSSVLQALLVLRQSFETGTLSDGALLPSGERVDLGTDDDLLFAAAKDRVVGFALRDVRDGKEDVWEQDIDIDENMRYIRDNMRYINFGRMTQTPFDYLSAAWLTNPLFGGRLIYVNAERVGPRKAYPRPGLMAWPNDFGVNSEYAWSYLYDNRDEVASDMWGYGDPRLVALEGIETEDVGRLRIVGSWLGDIVGSDDISLQLSDVAAADAVIASFSLDPAERLRYRATNVGFGLSYVLPVVLALLAEPGTLCLIENPESHLHPRGQTKLGELAARAAKAGVQVFVETHSDHFMDGVRIAVRDGLIKPEDVAFHYFERQDGKAVVSSPQVDADGRLSEWPAGFFDQHEENLVRLLAPRS